VFYFGRKVENEMAQAEAEIRKAHKSNPGTDRLAYAARLAALERNLGVQIKRHKNPDDLIVEKKAENGDEVVFIKAESG